MSIGISSIVLRCSTAGSSSTLRRLRACSAEQRAELVNLARSRTAEARLVERARIVLACLEGKRNDEVSRELGVRPNTVGLWRKRFAARGIAGLRDQARPGKKPKYGAELR